MHAVLAPLQLQVILPSTRLTAICVSPGGRTLDRTRHPSSCLLCLRGSVPLCHITQPVTAAGRGLSITRHARCARAKTGLAPALACAHRLRPLIIASAPPPPTSLKGVPPTSHCRRAATSARSRPVLTSLPLEIFFYFGGWWDAFYWLVLLAVYIYKGGTAPTPHTMHVHATAMTIEPRRGGGARASTLSRTVPVSPCTCRPTPNLRPCPRPDTAIPFGQVRGGVHIRVPLPAG